MKEIKSSLIKSTMELRDLYRITRTPVKRIPAVKIDIHPATNSTQLSHKTKTEFPTAKHASGELVLCIYF